VFEHPRQPPDAQFGQTTPVDTTAQWREDWQSASVVNYTTVTDLTNREPVFDLPRQSLSLLNCFRTGQGPCRAILHKWGLAKSPTSDCGQQQTMSHIVDTCPSTKLDDG